MPPRAPTGLSTRARRLWRDVVKTYVLDGDGLALLEVACRSMTRLEEAEQTVAEEGLTADGSKGQPVAHPLLAVIDRERTGFLRAMRQLDLEPDE